MNRPSSKISSRILATVLLALLFNWVDWASARQSPETAEAGSELTVSLITIGPGNRLSNLFGHTAIRIQDASRGTDYWYDYGHSDVDETSGAMAFLRGPLNYWMERREARPELARYARKGRAVVAQLLHLEPEERLRLQSFLESNATPEHRYFRYDYYYDNCSTRVRDAIDRATGGALYEQTASVTSPTTLRHQIREALDGRPALAAGVMLASGPAVDRPISVWDEMFLPHALAARLPHILVGPDGTQSLVEREVVMAKGAVDTTSRNGQGVPPWLVGICTALVMLVLGWRSRGSPLVHRLASVLLTLWYLTVGMVGTLLIIVWLVGTHWSVAGNANLLLLNPLALLVAFMVPLVGQHRRSVRKVAERAAVLTALLTAAALSTNLAFGQNQLSMWALSLVMFPNVAAAVVVHLLPRATTVRTKARRPARGVRGLLAVEPRSLAAVSTEIS